MAPTSTTISDEGIATSGGNDHRRSQESTPRSDCIHPGKRTPPPRGTARRDSVEEQSVPGQNQMVEKDVANPQHPGKWAVIRRLWNWKPRPARYDAANPPKFTIWLNLLFGFATCFTVSNLYYNQAILNRIAETFNVSFERGSSVATLMQAGYAAGLLLICPLGDVFPRRPFILSLIAFTAALVTLTPEPPPLSSPDRIDKQTF
ncbi:hypothetical protein VTK56DRAFT_6046 [Thermocarpiscus australiensis]